MTGIPAAGAHGGDGPAIARALGIDVLDLSQSLNPFAPDVAAMVTRHAGAVGAYPDPATATVLLAEALGVDPERVLLTNGGSEAISVVATELGGGVAAEPEFSLHPRGAGPRWRSDPHNPTGRLAGDEDCDVWDEAFYPLATGRWHGGRPGVTVGSLTKTFACPGLRLGYVIADDVERFARHQPHWSVSTLALAALPDLLAAADLPGWFARIAEARAALTDLLAGHGFDVDAADAPWVLVDSPGLRDHLGPHGVAVRDCASFGMPGWHRIAVTDPAGLDRLDRALNANL
ncbi:MAG: aminotransferase class I/II-fold pyridoxal phosphate-dependent enzyme [Actinomycetota bacterium]